MKKLLVFAFLMLLLAAPVVAQKPANGQDTVPTVVLSGKNLQVQNVNAGDKLEVLSIVGVKVMEKRLDGNNQTITLDLPKGYYIVKIGSSVRKISVK
jgi:hypothetical protein